ncbi:MipA/OmpV family protein [Marinimicrobium alkaliphilum]|uniref:MipA/OmpV family protein n=1 Tax=Marinimicrobium alkaliphilum TaxID=2202654 RepID=UPI000DB914A8|nr:MipA/OmpV family protein [Marinimicrobium alkaliphilum]
MRALLFLLTLALGAAAMAAEQIEQTLELGIGIGGVSAPDYRGSREYRHTLSPIPYLVYRGRFFQADRDGLRGEFLRHDLYELNISASATLTPESHRNPLREGMPSIYSTLEIGPALNVNVTGQLLEEGWMLSLPVHAVIQVGGRPDPVGWVAHPQLVYRWPFAKSALTYRTGLYFADRHYHRHYYAVAEEFATDERPEYNVGGGYSGWSHQLVLSRRTENWWYGAYVRYENLSGAVFIDSPLAETRHAIASGAGISRVIF